MSHRSHLPHITPESEESIGGYFRASVTSFASAVWPSANLAIYVPFTITETITVTQMFTLNGAAVSGNVDVGIYAMDGTRIISIGSTAHSGTSAIQAYNITDTALPPGRYFMACSVDNGTAAFNRYTDSATDVIKAMGVFQQASAFPLPATATFATMTQNYVPCMGLSQRSFI